MSADVINITKRLTVQTKYNTNDQFKDYKRLKDLMCNFANIQTCFLYLSSSLELGEFSFNIETTLLGLSTFVSFNMWRYSSLSWTVNNRSQWDQIWRQQPM